MNDMHIWKIIAVIAFVTAALRFLPFIVFGNGRKTPKIIEKLGRTLPYAVMGMLVIYCLKDISFSSISGFLSMLIAGLVVSILHVWKRNTLVSITGGTVCYMVLVQMIF